MPRLWGGSSRAWLVTLLAQVAVVALGACGRDALRNPGRDSGAGGGAGGSGGGGGGFDSGGSAGRDVAGDRAESGTDLRPGSVPLTLQPSVVPPLPVGQSLQVRAFIQLGGGTRDVTGEPELVWSSGNPASAVVAERGGRVTGVAPGRADIRAEHPLFGTASVSVPVTTASVTALVLEPPDLRLRPGEARPLAARASYGDGSESDVTFAAQWLSLDQRIARVGSGVERPGLVTAMAMGDTQVTAAFAGAQGQVRIAVSGGMAEPSLMITPDSLTRPPNGTAAFRAVARLASGAITDVTSQASWGVANPTLATSLGAGQFRCNGGGATTVTARFMQLSDSASLRCESSPAEVRELRLAPFNSDLFVGIPYRVEVEAVFADGSSMRIANNGQLTWSSSDEAIAPVDAMGVLTAIQPGTVTITARSGAAMGQQSYSFRAR